MLEQLYKSAYEAYRGTSFDPEKRATQTIKDYEEQLQSDLNEIAAASAEIKEQYKQRFIKFFSAWLASRSRIISPMISGPSNFPTRRMQKYGNWEDNAYNRFSEFRDKALTGIKKQIERDKPEEQKQDEAWQKIEREIMRTAGTIAAIDNGTERGLARPLFVSSLTGFIKRLAANGQTEHVKKAIELIRQINSTGKPIITEKNSIFSLVETAQAVEEIKHDRLNRESDSFNFEGGEVVINYEADRIQIFFTNRPTREELTAWKAKGLNSFNWSPSNNAWQRKITTNAIWATEKMLGIALK